MVDNEEQAPLKDRVCLPRAALPQLGEPGQSPGLSVLIHVSDYCEIAITQDMKSPEYGAQPLAIARAFPQPCLLNVFAL